MTVGKLTPRDAKYLVDMMQHSSYSRKIWALICLRNAQQLVHKTRVILAHNSSKKYHFLGTNLGCCNKHLHGRSLVLSSNQSKEQFFIKSGTTSQHCSARNHHNLCTWRRCGRNSILDKTVRKTLIRVKCLHFGDGVLFDKFTCNHTCDNHVKYYCKKTEFVNPIDRLQQYVDVPILSPENHLFKPSEAEMKTAGKFWTQSMKEMKFLTSAKFHEQLPEDNLPEVTFIGRSNVGKSSLIQALFVKSDVVVRISKTPGFTKLLNFFEVTKHFRVVDVPGYGFRMPKDYSEMVEEFLKNRPRLARTFLLLDGAGGLNQTDVIGINMVEEFQLPYVMTFLMIDGARGFHGIDVDKYEILVASNIQFGIVITKIDKVPTNILLRNVMEIQRVMKDTKFCFPQPFLVSSATGEGIPLLQTFIAYVTGNLAIKGM